MVTRGRTPVGLSGRMDGTASPGFAIARPMRVWAAVLLAIFLGVSVLFMVHAYRYKDHFVFVTVEESSSRALAAWPLGWERLPGVFVDCENRCLELEKTPPLWGVSLVAYYSASSQGIEYDESLDFSRTGKVTVALARPVSATGCDLEGNDIELIDNSARVVRGDLVIEGTDRSGLVRFRYGGERFALSPGEAWAQVLALVDGNIVEVGPEAWEGAVDWYLNQGVPVTRVAVANRGLWPKSGVRQPEGEGGETR